MRRASGVGARSGFQSGLLDTSCVISTKSCTAIGIAVNILAMANTPAFAHRFGEVRRSLAEAEIGDWGFGIRICRMKRTRVVLMLLIAALAMTSAQIPVRDWPFYGGDAGGTRFSPLARITRDNVTNLVVAWAIRPVNRNSICPGSHRCR